MDQNEAINWVGEAIARLRDELDCCLRHYERREFSNIVVHASNMDTGIRAVGALLFEYVLDMPDRAEVVKVRHETATGQLMKVEEFADGFMLIPEEVVVPEPEDFM